MKYIKKNVWKIVIYIIIFLFLFRYFLSILFSSILISFIEEITCIVFSFCIPLLFSFIVSFFYKMDFFILYFTVFIIQWILFLNVNPYPVNLDNKFSVMELFPDKYKPEIQFLLSDIQNQKFTYPVIVKPIYCSGDGKQIKILNNDTELELFLKTSTNINSYMVQNYLENHNVEIGVLYETYPWGTQGRILEIVEKTNTEDKIRIYKDNKSKIHKINEKISQIFHNLKKYVPNANVMRYDIRLKKIEDLESDEFKIVEMNGTMGMPLMPFHIASDLAWYSRRIFIGLVNILMLKGYSPINLVIAMCKSYYNMSNCNDYENLFSLYS